MHLQVVTVPEGRRRVDILGECHGAQLACVGAQVMCQVALPHKGLAARVGALARVHLPLARVQCREAALLALPQLAVWWATTCGHPRSSLQ